MMNSASAGHRRYLPSSPFKPPPDDPPPEEFEVDDLVTHDKYGLGTVTAVEEGIAVLVDFGSHERRLSTPCAKLTKL